MKPPCEAKANLQIQIGERGPLKCQLRLLILDPQDFTIQEIFGIRGEDWPALDLRHRYQFPSKALPASVPHLRETSWCS